MDVCPKFYLNIVKQHLLYLLQNENNLKHPHKGIAFFLKFVGSYFVVLKLMQFPCSDALSYCHLAEGKVDVVIQCSNKIWDIHPIMPIIKASGGNISTWDNKNAIKAGNILVAANNIIHKKFLKLLKPVSK